MFFKKEIEKDDPFIGEVLIRVPNGKYYSSEAPHVNSLPKDNSSLQWIKFKASDLSKRHDEYVEIFGVFVKMIDVLFYDLEAFKDFKQSVENKYNQNTCASKEVEDIYANTNRLCIDILKINLQRAFDRIVELEKKVEALQPKPKTAR